MNDTKKTFAVIGGDMRQASLAHSLAADGYSVKIYGFDRAAEMTGSLNVCDDVGQALSDAQFVILPLPVCVEGDMLNAPFSKCECTNINEVLDAITPNQIVVGGRIEAKYFSVAGRRGFRLIDYFERDEMAVLNAIPTSEGAIQIAMEELPITLHGSRCVIVGFGRIGKVLAAQLHALGANVEVCARKYSDLAWISAYGYAAVPMERAAERAAEADVIFNTAPALIFTSDALGKLKPDALIIDLASKPGGVDFGAAQSLGVKVIWALSLPGKVAPRTSGEIIKRTVLNICQEVGFNG